MLSERTSSPITPANAPSGIVEALRVAWTQIAGRPSAAAAAFASRASRDLPAPAGAYRITPAQSSRRRASAIRPSSLSRPTSGH